MTDQEWEAAVRDMSKAMKEARQCPACGEPEDGGEFGWFDVSADECYCNACGNKID